MGSKFDLTPIIKFEKDRDHLKEYVYNNFRDSEMIDYERETKAARDLARMTDDEIDREFASNSKRSWKFLSENVIFRDSKNSLNKH